MRGSLLAIVLPVSTAIDACGALAGTVRSSASTPLPRLGLTLQVEH